MPLTAEEIPGRRTANASINGERRYGHVYRVVGTGLADEQVDVLTATGLPALGDVHPEDATCFVIEEAPREVQDDYAAWEVDVTYSNKAPDSAQANPDPTLRPSVISYDDENDEVVWEADADGNTVRNAAEDPFDPPLTKEVGYLLVTVTRTQGLYDPLDALSYKNTVNELEVLGFEARTAKMLNITGHEHWEGAVLYYDVTYKFAVKAMGDADPAYGPWNPEILNAGYQAFNAALTVKSVITDDRGQPYQSPQLLKANGEKLPVGGTPTYLQFRKYADKDWTPLNLP